MDNYSVLMSVYHEEQPEFLRQSVESMFSQTVLTNDFILMCDGPLTQELDLVIDELCQKYGNVLRIIRLETNRGLGYALNCGIRECKNDLVARMDSDDIAFPNRCELQLRKFEEEPSLAIVGGAIAEFVGNTDNIVSVKYMPEKHRDVVRYSRKRNPFNHPTVMYRKSAVLAVGAYPDRKLHEDYALWANLILSGAQVCNLSQILCYMRVDSGLYERRGGWEYLKKAVALRWHLYQSGLYTLGSFLYVVTGLTIVCLLPLPLRKLFYRTFLR